MKKTMIFSLLAVFILAFSVNASTWEIEGAHSSIAFKVSHLMLSKVNGNFQKFTGSVNYDPEQPGKSSTEVSIDVTSVNTNNEKRDGHLRSADFFNVESFPNMMFKSKKVENAGKGKLKVTGDLTMLDKTNEVTLMVEGPFEPIEFMGSVRSGARATGKINRNDWGMTWNKNLDKGGVVVGEEVEIIIDVELVKKD